MPCYTRMKTICLRGLLWLYLLGVGYVVVSVEPGYLDFDNLPDTNFSCVGKVIGGYYADLETNCQMFHVCTIGQLDEPMDIRFLCLNGTVFDQETRVCERIDEVDCSKSEQFYSLNLELYGNTQPSISEDNADTDPPIIIKASTTTTTTTTTTQRPKTKTTKAAFFTTVAPAVTTVTKVISAHHFPISGGPDIRFNPEEINISLNPGSGPNIRSKTVAYQQQVFSNSDNNKKIVVTTHTSYGPEKEDFVRVVPNTPRPQVSSTQRVKIQSPATPADINYGFTHHQTEDINQEYTESPHHNYQYHHSPTYSHQQYRNQFKTTTYRTQHVATTRKHPYNPNKEPTTYRTPYVSSLKTPAYQYRTEKPQRLQLPLPLLPTLPPLTFSSPAPFSLGHHIETKRYTSDQHPRIIISASASVSDSNGQRKDFPLGTIGVTPLLEEPPKSYDDYKDHDVVLDPFYHDVPKIKAKRRKRQVKTSDADGDQAAADVLKFLFDWYRNHQKTSTVKVPIGPEDITEINEQLAAIVEAPILDNKNKKEIEEIYNFKESALFQRKSKFNIVGDILSVTEKPVVSTLKPTPITVAKLETVDYVDDNYEAAAHQEVKKSGKEEKKDKVTTTEKLEVTTFETTTLPPTTTTTEPTTTSRIMGILRRRAKVHQERILAENKRRYMASLNALKPKVRGQTKQRSTTESHKIETTIETVTPVAPTKAKRKGFTPTRAKVSSTTTPKSAPRKTRAKKTLCSTTVKPSSTTTPKPVATTPDILSATTVTSSSTTTQRPTPAEVTTELLKTTTVKLSPTTTPSPKEIESTTESNIDEDKFTTAISEETTRKIVSEELATAEVLMTEENEDTYVWQDQLQEESRKGTHFQETTTISEDFEEEKIPENETSTLKQESQVVEVTEEPDWHEKERLEEITENHQKQDLADENLEDTHETTAVMEESEDSEETENEETSQIEETQIEEREKERDTSSDSYSTTEENLKADVLEDEESQKQDKENLEETSKNINNNQETEDESFESFTETTTTSENTEDKIQNEATTQKEETQTQTAERTQLRSRGRGRSRFRAHHIEFKENEEATQRKIDNEDKKIKEDVVEKTTQTENKEDETQIADVPNVETVKSTFRGRRRNRLRSHVKVDEETVSPKEETLTEITEEPKNEENVEATTIEEVREDEKLYDLEDAGLSKPTVSESDDETKITSSIPDVTTIIEEVEEHNKEDLNDSMPTDSIEEEVTYPLTEVIRTTASDDDYDQQNEHKETTTSLTTSTTQHYEETTTSELYQTIATESSTIAEDETSANLTPAETTTTEIPITSRGRSSRRKPRPRPVSDHRRPNPRHRFSTELTSRPTRRKPLIEDEIIEAITSQLTTTESLTREEIHSTSPKIPTSTLVDFSEDVPATDAPLFKSANPTQAESAKESLHTTPLSMVYKLHVRKERLKSYIFNCFGKAINKFYSDPRDCRLFHYCTSGYTKNQLLDMKFVCDLGTYFDEEELICTKTKPERCL